MFKEVKSNEKLQTCPVCNSDQYSDGFCGNCFKQITEKSETPYVYVKQPTDEQPTKRTS